MKNQFTVNKLLSSTLCIFHIKRWITGQTARCVSKKRENVYRLDVASSAVRFVI